MSNYNHVTLVGRISRMDELRQTSGGHDVLNFGLAVNRDFSKSDEVDFFNITAWRKTAELVSQYKNVGDLILVSGRLQTDNYEKNGETRTSTFVQADTVRFLSSKGAGGGGESDDSEDGGGVPF